MENHYADVFRVIFKLNCFVLLLSFSGATSAPVTKTQIPSVIDIMRIDSKLCPAGQVLYDSEYIKPCASVAYPTAPWNYNAESLNDFLCLGVYDTAYKICHYSSQLQIDLNSTAIFNSYVEKYVPDENKSQNKFCESLQGFTSLYEKIDSLWTPLVQKLNTPHTCVKICFDFRDKFNPLCAVFAWIKSNDDTVKSIEKAETKHMATDKSYIIQSEDKSAGDVKTTSGGSKNTEAKDFKEQNGQQIIIDSDSIIKKGNSNMPGNVPSAGVKFDEEKTKPDTEKTNSNQKKINNTLETQVHKSSTFKENKENIGTEFGTDAEVVKPIKGILNSVLQAPSLNNINKVINEVNADKSKEQEIVELKPSTISENTQDHYDAENPDENLGNDLDDVGDTIQHPDIGNQNENVQEIFEQKDNAKLSEYSSMRTEDDSHFFAYFTVIILACLAGYIGYHNKQKLFAIVLEGRRSRNNRSRRRPSTASYRKLDCTLEEAVTSQCNSNVTHVIY